MEKWWMEIFTFLSQGSYPEKFNKGQRPSLRKYALKFSIRDGELFFRGQRRVIKLEDEAMNLFKTFHASPMGGHTGLMKTRSAVYECDKCQRVGGSLSAVKKPECIKASAVWELIGIDLIGPLPKTSSGFQYILTATDYLSKWVEAFPLQTKSAVQVARNLCKMFYRHGCPKRILTDQGRAFVNQINNQLCELLSIEVGVTAYYHPQTSGLDEKTNNNIKRALGKLVNMQQDNWDIYLDATLFSLRLKVHTSTNFSPFFLMYGREARFPSEVPVEMPLSSITLPEDCRAFIKEKREARYGKRKRAEENIKHSQQKMTEAFEKRKNKKHRASI